MAKLKELGWVRDSNGWVIPPGRTAAQQDNNWCQAIEESIECPYDDGVVPTEVPPLS